MVMEKTLKERNKEEKKVQSEGTLFKGNVLKFEHLVSYRIH